MLMQGANRQLQIPRELKRFKDLPMSVTYSLAPDDEKISNRILQILELQETEVLFCYARCP